jgi:hypothetical protein
MKTIAQNFTVRNSLDYWIRKNRYYHQQVASFYAANIPPMERVLHINCGSGHILEALTPSFGVGVYAHTNDNDHQSTHIALEELPTEPFEYIIISFVTQQPDDVQELLQELHRFCTPRTRIFVDTYSYAWEPLLWLSSKLGIRRATPFTHWISRSDLANFFYLANFDIVTTGGHLLLPVRIPLLSWLFNTVIARLPLFNKLCLHQWTLVRPKPSTNPEDTSPTVSVIVPCRNERGNVEAAVQRIPKLGTHTEIIFVEGHSTDGTREEIERVINKHPEQAIRSFVQQGNGKGDAVRLGFAQATGDIVLILDGDLTMPPEDLPRFVDALTSGKGEFINGSRLVYGMESNAMRFLNLCANFFFAQLFSWILNQRVKDTLCGTKALYKKDYERIADNRALFGTADPFGDFDLLFGAARLHLKIVDMPIRYQGRTYGTTNISRFKHGFILLWMSVRGMYTLKFKQ